MEQKHFKELGAHRCWELAGVGQEGQQLQLPKASLGVAQPSHLGPVTSEVNERGTGVWEWYDKLTCEAAFSITQSVLARGPRHKSWSQTCIHNRAIHPD